ncbi:MAG: hypothetical protein WBC69_11080 [Geitlerinemataceae cyanobacterium]
MNSTLTSRIDRFQFVTNDRDSGFMSSEFDRLPSLPPPLETDTDYDLIQLCDDLASIEQDNPPNS